MNHYYQPSGKISFASFLYLLAACLTVLPVLGFIYAYAIWYIPFIYINFFIAAGFGFLIGLAANYLVITMGKVRNPKMALLFGLVVGVTALYAHWCVWLSLVLNAGESYGSDRLGITVSNASVPQTLLLLFQPKAVMQLMGAVNETGTWGIRGATVSGWFLSIIWIIESLIVTIIPLLVLYGGSKKPYMEKIDKWSKEKELPALTFIEDTTGFKEALEKNDFGVLENLSPVSNHHKQNDKHSIFTLFHYPGHSEYYLSVTNKIPEVDDKGKISFKSETIVENLWIDFKMGELLRNLKETEETIHSISKA